MEEIFISYKSERRRAAEHLAEVLRRHGYTVWFDYHLIKGDDYDFQLDAKLVAAKAVVVLWCTLSVESKWVSREATRAIQRGTLVPAMIETCELKTAYVNVDYIDLRSWDGGPRSHALDPLFDELERKIGRPPVPDVKALRAYEETWRRFGAPSLKAFAIDGPRETAETRVAEAAVAERSALPGSDPRAAEAAQVWPDVRDSGDVRRLKRFEEIFRGTFYAAEATELREAIEAEVRRKQLDEERARRREAERATRGEPLRTLAGHKAEIEAVAITADGRFAVSGGHDSTVRVWDLATGRNVQTLMGDAKNWILALALTSDARFAVSGCTDSTLHVWDLGSGKVLRKLKGHADCVRAVALTPDGQLAVSGSDDNTLKVWEVASGRELRSLVGHALRVTAVALISDRQRAVSGSQDDSLKIWDLVTGRQLRTMVGQSAWVRAVAVTPDGHLAVSGGDDGTLKVWDIATGTALRTLTGHTSVVLAVAVTPDGRLAVSACRRGTLKVWDIAKGRELRTLAGHSSAISAIALTPDGRLAVSGSHDKTLKVWDISDL